MSGKEGETVLEEDVELQGLREPQCAKLIAEQVRAAFILPQTLQPRCKQGFGISARGRGCSEGHANGERVFVGQVEEIEALKRRVQELEHMLAQKPLGGAVVA